MTDIRKELRSYKQLPQICTNFKPSSGMSPDHERPAAGAQFIMKDIIFDLDDAGLDVSYKKHMRPIARVLTAAALTLSRCRRFRRYGRFAIARVYGDAKPAKT